MRGFRVWSDYWKKYATEAELYMDGSVDAIFEDDDEVPHHENTDLVLEFETGLEDKNGKEIYEGDIVETPIYGVWTTGNSDAIFGEKMWKLAVFWADADCGFLFKVIGSKNQPNRVYDILDQHLGAFEVIGNIHENPELLEEEE